MMGAMHKVNHHVSFCFCFLSYYEPVLREVTFSN